MAIDAEDNVWICDANGSTVMKLSGEGNLLLTIGFKGKRGDWNEAEESTCSAAARSGIRDERRHLYRRWTCEREPE